MKITHLLSFGAAILMGAGCASDYRQTYDGALEVGEDLMSFEIGDTVTVRRFKA